MFTRKHPIYNTPIAHRGFHTPTVDENSLAAFKAAMDAGYGIEIDVHVTSDKQVVVMHDTTTGRTMDKDLVVVENTYEKLSSLKLQLTKEKIPLLSDVFALIDGRVPILIEVKAENNYSPHLVESVIREVEKYTHKETLGLQSFNPYVVRAMREAQNEVPVGQLMSDALPGQSKLVHFLYRTLLVLKISKPHFFSYDVAYIKKRRIQRKRKKMPLLAWTIDTEEKYAITKRFADNIIFEHINL